MPTSWTTNRKIWEDIDLARWDDSTDLLQWGDNDSDTLLVTELELTSWDKRANVTETSRTQRTPI